MNSKESHHSTSNLPDVGNLKVKFNGNFTCVSYDFQPIKKRLYVDMSIVTRAKQSQV